MVAADIIHPNHTILRTPVLIRISNFTDYERKFMRAP
jgi:hypothetical protein